MQDKQIVQIFKLCFGEMQQCIIPTSILNIFAELNRTFEDESSDGTLVSQINSKHANDSFVCFQKSLEYSTSIRLSPETMKR